MVPTAPPAGKDIQSLVDKRLDEVRKGHSTRETVTIEWRGRQLSIEVIDMPVAMLYYNPETHRIRAQREHDADRDARLTTDPWAEESQEYLHDLLKANPANPERDDPDFQGLQDDLKSYGQKDPGIITPTGILVNGNTRRAALKELGHPNIRVGVLPGDWGWEDIGAVELELQLRKEHRREYSYINRLITIEEQISKGRTTIELAKAFRTTQKAIQQDRWVLAFLQDAIERSRVTLADGSSASMHLIDFEKDQEKLKELHRAYTVAESKDRDLADQLRESRLLAVAIGHSKTDVRVVEEGFHEKYLEPRLSPDLKPTAATLPDSIGIPGLTISVPDSSIKAQEIRALTDKVLQAQAQMNASSKLTTAETAKASKVITAVTKAVDDSIDHAKRDQRAKKRKLAAQDTLSDATDQLKLCIDEIARARSQGALDNDALDEELINLRDTLRRLAQQASRGVAEPGKGLSWLQRATTGQD
ncbi:hypothetical protein SAMN05216275_11581 [Streptosporangium canum]|uniref:Transcriptional regulator n=1 Tax=Streptosporangium canum TaxID=324952 RepID=A0A1I3VYR3_9ACTN|nr:ParB N-terminal domain-containing protein [Streptosporangium canum]SFK00300.1 hypothetical protein SAMN05216275_11581 [Streptosporangium canum]